MTTPTTRFALLAALLAVLPAAPALAQAVPVPAPAAAARALTQEVVGIYERVCLAATLRGEAVPDAVARALGSAAAPVPADQLGGNQQVRETAAWLVSGLYGRYRLNTLEPGGQCGLVGEGVDHDAFLAAAAEIMARGPAFMPGWEPQGAPQRSGGPRPFGTLTYLAASYTRRDAPPPAPLRVLAIVASAAERTDGRPNTGVISVSLREEAGR